MKLLFSLVSVLLIQICIWTGANAQNLKLGYTNAELVLSLMPEAKQMEAALRTHENKLMQNLNVKKSYYESKVKEYEELKGAGKMTAEQETTMVNDIKKLEEEIQAAAKDSEDNYLKKREELMQPIVDKLQKAIDEVSTEENYTYVFNQNVNGTSILLKGPKQDNITIKILKKLNIEIPKELEEALAKEK